MMEEEKKVLLRRIGWNEELINRCFSEENDIPQITPSPNQIDDLCLQESDLSNMIINEGNTHQVAKSDLRI